MVLPHLERIDEQHESDEKQRAGKGAVRGNATESTFDKEGSRFCFNIGISVLVVIFFVFGNGARCVRRRHAGRLTNFFAFSWPNYCFSGRIIARAADVTAVLCIP